MHGVPDVSESAHTVALASALVSESVCARAVMASSPMSVPRLAFLAARREPGRRESQFQAASGQKGKQVSLKNVVGTTAQQANSVAKASKSAL